MIVKLLMVVAIAVPLAVAVPSIFVGQARLLITKVTVIDVENGRTQPDTTIEINGDKITRIGPASSIPVAKGTRVVDGTRKFLMPGLWDMHAHVDRTAYIPMLLANGVTGARAMGNTAEQLQSWRQAVAASQLDGPRLVVAGRIIDGRDGPKDFSDNVSTETEARQAVVSHKKNGWDFIKVWSLLPRNLYFAVADEAKKQGLPLTGHVPVEVSVAEASDTGQRSIEHLNGMLLACSNQEEQLMKQELAEIRMGQLDALSRFLRLWFYGQSAQLVDSYSETKAQGLFKRLRKNGTWNCPELVMWRAYAFLDESAITKDPRTKYVPPKNLAGWNWKSVPFLANRTPSDIANQKRLFRKYLELVGAMKRTGLDFLAGTDSGLGGVGVYPGFSVHDEMGLFVQAGFSPLEALQTATINPTRYFGRLNSLGTVAKGKIADLVLLDANPLHDIRNAQKVSAVFMGGRLLERAKLDQMLAGAEAEINRP